MLSVIIDAFMDGTIPDALLVPVSVNYERLVDGNFVYEQLGQKKKPETFMSAISAIWNILNSKYGLMRIDFKEPYSMRELVNAFNNNKTISSVDSLASKSLPRQNSSTASLKRLTHKPSTSSLYGTDIVDEEHRNLVDSIARHVVYDCASTTAVMTTNAVSFLLLTRSVCEIENQSCEFTTTGLINEFFVRLPINRFRDGAPIDVLAEALDELRNTLQAVRNIGFTGDSRDVIIYSANLLGPSKLAIVHSLSFATIALHNF